MKRFTKTQLARAYLALSHTKSPEYAAQALAAALLAQKMSHEVEIVVREVARQLLGEGQALVTVATARPVSPTLQKTMEAALGKFTQVRAVAVDYRVNPALLGGFYAETPTHTFDASLASTLNRLASAAAAV